MNPDIDNIIDLFGEDYNDNDNDNIERNESFFIAEILKLIQSTNENSLYIYSMLKCILQKQHLLTESHKKEIIEILNIKPKIVEKIVVKEKVVYKERKAKVYDGDDY